MKKKNVGSTFDSWLREEGIYEEATSAAIKRVLARQIEAAMKEQSLSKSEMARRMHTSRAALGRLLDPDNDAVTLGTLRKTGEAVGREIRPELAWQQKHPSGPAATVFGFTKSLLRNPAASPARHARNTSL